MEGQIYEQQFMIREGIPDERDINRDLGLEGISFWEGAGGLVAPSEAKELKEDLLFTGLENEYEVLLESGVFQGQDYFLDDLSLLQNPDQSEEQPEATVQKCEQQSRLVQAPIRRAPPPKKKGGKSKNGRKNRSSKKSQINKNSETKNIPKNYGKQIIKFVNNSPELVSRTLAAANSRLSYTDLTTYLRGKKKAMNKISDLKDLWLSDPHAKVMRILSYAFIRKFSHSWIFNSRIKQHSNPLKYRERLIQGVQNPQEFLYLKEY